MNGWPINGSVLVKDIFPGNSSNPGGFAESNGIVFFAALNATNNSELWRSDGTDAGTFLVKEINTSTGSAPGSNPRFLTNVNGTIFFSAFDPIHGIELWKTDGTEAGTVLVADISPGTADTHFDSLFNFNGTLFFEAKLGDGGLWRRRTVADFLVKTSTPASRVLGREMCVVGTLYFFRRGLDANFGRLTVQRREPCL